MKYDVKCSCGHEETVELFGKSCDRDKKISYIEKYGMCKACKEAARIAEAAKKAADGGLVEIEMTYREYKLNYSDNKTVPGSYNADDKTIKVYAKQ